MDGLSSLAPRRRGRHPRPPRPSKLVVERHHMLPPPPRSPTIMMMTMMNVMRVLGLLTVRIILGEVALDTTGWALLLPRHKDTWIVLDCGGRFKWLEKTERMNNERMDEWVDSFVVLLYPAIILHPVVMIGEPPVSFPSTTRMGGGIGWRE